MEPVESTEQGAVATEDIAGAPVGENPGAAALQIRDRVRYEIVGEHGRGGLGRVYRAHDKELRREVAIKELIARSYTSEQRFFREAMITARLEHPGIVPVHEAGRWPDGTPFYAMKLVSGEPLSRLLQQSRSPEDRRALVPHLAAVAEAIAYAHDQRIIHRDLKPANVIIGRFGETVVIDWGLAKDLTEQIADGPFEGPYRTPTSDDLTQEGTVLGTRAYMAPEQALGEPADERSDVYALGAMMRELLRGVDDDDLTAIMRRATAMMPDERYPSARELVADLRAYLGGRRISARRYSVAATVRHWIAHHRALTAAIGLAALIIAIVSAIAILRVVRERDRATAQRERALLAQARMLIAEDPTEAWRLLDANGLTDRDPVLSARIHAAGVADRVIPLRGYGAPALAAFATPGRYAAVTFDRTLHVVDVAAGTVQEVARGLPSLGLMMNRGDEFAYVARRGDRFVLAIARADGTTRDIGPIEKLPSAIDYDGSALFLLGGDDVLTRFDVATGTARELDRDVATFVVAGAHLYVCHHDGSLIRDGERLDEPCDGDAPVTAMGSTAVLASSDDTLLVLDGPRVRRVPFDTRVAAPSYEVAASGLVVGVDADGNGLYLPPGASAFERVRFAALRPATIAASGTLAAWGFTDGTVVVHDTATHDVWTLKTRRTPFEFLFLEASAMRVVTWADREFRVWSLEPGVARSVGATDSRVLRAATAPTGDRVLLDSRSGQATLVTPSGVILLHRHTQLALSAAWLGELACTGSRDASVMCSDPQTGEVALRRETPASVRGIAATADDLVYASVDGTVGLVTTGEVLFRTDDEPRRVRVSGDRLVVSDLGGNLVTYDLTARRVIARRHAHVGAVWEVDWAGDDIVSTGQDDSVAVWTASLEPRWSFTASGDAGILAVGADRIVVVTDRGTAHVLSADGRELGRVELGGEPTAIATSPSSTRVAVATVDGELLVLRLPDLAIEARRVDRSALTCASFVTDHDLVACSFAGGLFRVHLPLKRQAP
jgi:hypothetical protein